MYWFISPSVVAVPSFSFTQFALKTLHRATICNWSMERTTFRNCWSAPTGLWGHFQGIWADLFISSSLRNQSILHMCSSSCLLGSQCFHQHLPFFGIPFLHFGWRPSLLKSSLAVPNRRSFLPCCSGSAAAEWPRRIWPGKSDGIYFVSRAKVSSLSFTLQSFTLHTFLCTLVPSLGHSLFHQFPNNFITVY